MGTMRECPAFYGRWSRDGYRVGYKILKMSVKQALQEIHLPVDKQIYFCSDFHLGVPGKLDSRSREKMIVSWLSGIQPNVHTLFLVGDIFDFWFEYKQVVPKGFVRLLGKLAELSDAGVQLIFFTGNHDMWMRDYFSVELNAEILREPKGYLVRQGSSETSLLVGHGDGLGPGDNFYKSLKQLFESPVARWGFRQIHPDLGVGLAQKWSRNSRLANKEKGEDEFRGAEFEWLYSYAKEVEAVSHHDYYLFGHRHLPLDLKISDTSRYINLGEWFSKQTYAVLDKGGVELKAYSGGK